MSKEVNFVDPLSPSLPLCHCRSLKHMCWLRRLWYSWAMKVLIFTGMELFIHLLWSVTRAIFLSHLSQTVYDMNVLARSRTWTESKWPLEAWVADGYSTFISVYSVSAVLNNWECIIFMTTRQIISSVWISQNVVAYIAWWGCGWSFGGLALYPQFCNFSNLKLQALQRCDKCVT